MSLRDVLDGAVVMAPMTKGGNLPYRRLCAELGARVLMSEMTVARRLKQKRRAEFALIRRAPDEPFFGVQLAGTNPEEMGWAAALVESRGADLVDLNVGCPIDYFTRKGLGAALGRQPKRIQKIVEAMKRSVTRVPVSVKIRLGWNDSSRNYLEQAQAAVDGGADALVVHGRTRDARYRQNCDWDAIGEVATRMPVPVVGNGDILFPHDIEAARARSGCAGVMAGRGALIKPWLFREATAGYQDISANDRLAIYRRYVDLAREHWGEDEHGMARVKEFLRWHLGFWCRYAPRRPDGSWPGMQTRESLDVARSPLDVLLSRGDQAAHGWLTERLAARDDVDPAEAPAPDAPDVDREEAVEG
ncbi:MAG: tRNA-dihydrouridine synthase family protein [Acidobacteria bacterium]|nr:tRNA-dihydrouridine synthase family protein [Acidobacteriota bacterium]